MIVIMSIVVIMFVIVLLIVTVNGNGNGMIIGNVTINVVRVVVGNANQLEKCLHLV